MGGALVSAHKVRILGGRVELEPLAFYAGSEIARVEREMDLVGLFAPRREGCYGAPLADALRMRGVRVDSLEGEGGIRR